MTWVFIVFKTVGLSSSAVELAKVHLLDDSALKSCFFIGKHCTPSHVRFVGRKVKTLYTRARNISFEFTSEDVLCNLVNGKCNSQPPAVKNEVNCAYCELMHAKAYKISNHFADFFYGFNVLCSRIQDSDDKIFCQQHVSDMNEAIKNLMRLNLNEMRAKGNCKYFFFCKM
ncbi:hypothetical protein GPALN_002334 [Globodera pallida]|nr:hypothetical protein GPALN_002334 [Globodera pallida]